tara:strand:- start:5858 stop:6496 length:639 start_codon:yes stop_codon:yes gene_type:complete
MIYELRMYTTKPGKMKHVVNSSATVAQKIRNGDTYGKLIGHWWSQIGKMNQYVHMWEYQNVDEMRRLRSELSSRDDWKKEFVPLVGPYILSQEIRLLRSLSDLKKPSNINNFYELKIINLNIGKAGQWITGFNNLVNKIENESLNIGVWQTELSNPNEIVSIWSHSSVERMQMFWEKLENNSLWKKFMDFQESSVKEEQTIILRPSSCSPLQ